MKVDINDGIIIEMDKERDIWLDNNNYNIIDTSDGYTWIQRNI